MDTAIDTLLDTWCEAERHGDREQLDQLLTEDFVGIGPVGFTLPRAAWVDRLGPDLRYDDLGLDEVSTRSYPGATVVIAHQHAAGEAQGNPLPPDTRVSFVMVPAGDDLRIAGIQYSFMVPS